ncbi:MAG TPA: hypothetical protein VFM48_08640 [Aquabacterium sp.]|nr:hypothetical protein [Aquabacterium sp.]
MNRLSCFLSVVVAAASQGAWAQDAKDAKPAGVQGTQELPKVLYVVPWKKALPGEVNGRPQLSLINEPLKALDAEDFHREMQYQSQLMSQRQARGRSGSQP